MRGGWLWLGAALTLSGHGAQAQDHCADPGARCGGLIDPACVEQRIGAGALAMGEDAQAAACSGQIKRYRECLADVAKNCGPAESGRPAAAGGGCAPDLEQRLWDTVRESNDPDELRIFIKSCPNSPFAEIAERRIAGGGASRIAAPEAPSEASRGDYRAAQTELRRLGFYRGGVDGDWGAGSQQAMRDFQRKAGLPPDGLLTPGALAILRAAPTPAAPATPAPQQGYGGNYIGGWRSPAFGTSGRSVFQTKSFDLRTGALTGVMGIEYNGVMYQGLVAGRLTPQGGGQASGQIRAPDGTGWTTTLTYNPAGDYSRITGSFYSVPLPGTFGAAVNGVFETRRAR